MGYDVWQQGNMYSIWLASVTSSPSCVRVFDIDIHVPDVGKYWVTCEQVGSSITSGVIWVWDACPTPERHHRVTDWTSWYIYDDRGNDVSTLYARLAYFTCPQDRLVGGEQLCNHDWKDPSNQFAVIDNGTVIDTRYRRRNITANSLLNICW